MGALMKNELELGIANLSRDAETHSLRLNTGIHQSSNLRFQLEQLLW